MATQDEIREAEERLRREEEKASQFNQPYPLYNPPPPVPLETPESFTAVPPQEADYGEYGYNQQDVFNEATASALRNAFEAQGGSLQATPRYNIPTGAPSAVPQGDGGGMLPDVGTALKTGLLDVVSLMAGATAGVGELGRRISGSEEPGAMQTAAMETYRKLSEQSAALRGDMNDPLDVFKGLFGQSDERGVLSSFAHLPATLVETLANQAPFMALTMGVGGLFGKAGGKIAASKLGSNGMFARRAEKFMLDEGMREMRSTMTRAAWKKAPKAAMRLELQDKLKKEIAENSIRAYGARMGMNTGIVTGTSALEGGGMFGEAADEVGMGNVKLGMTALMGTAAGMMELTFGGGNLRQIRRHLGPKAEREALKVARRAAVADSKEIPGLMKKATAIMGRLAGASGSEAVQESSQELAAIANLVYNAPESIVDMDILERVGSAAVVGGMMGFGPAGMSEFTSAMSQKKSPDSAVPTPDGERVGVPREDQTNFVRVEPSTLTEMDRNALKLWGKKRYEDVKTAKSDRDRADRDFFEGSAEESDVMNWQNPDFILERFVNDTKFSTDMNPQVALNNIYKMIHGKDRPEYTSYNATAQATERTTDAASKQAADAKAAKKAAAAETTAEQERGKELLKARKGRAMTQGRMNAGYDKAPDKQKYLEGLVEANRADLGEEYEPDYSDHNALLEDIMEAKTPIVTTLNDEELTQHALLRLAQEEGRAASAVPMARGTLEGRVDVEQPLPISPADMQANLVNEQILGEVSGEMAGIPLQAGTPMSLEGLQAGAASPEGRQAINEAIAEGILSRKAGHGIGPVQAEGTAVPVIEQGLPVPQDVIDRLAVAGAKGVKQSRPLPTVPKKKRKKKAKATVKKAVTTVKETVIEDAEIVETKPADTKKIFEGKTDKEIKHLTTGRKALNDEERKYLKDKIKEVTGKGTKVRTDKKLRSKARELITPAATKPPSRRKLLFAAAKAKGVTGPQAIKLGAKGLEEKYGKDADKLAEAPVVAPAPKKEVPKKAVPEKETVVKDAEVVEEKPKDAEVKPVKSAKSAEKVVKGAEVVSEARVTSAKAAIAALDLFGRKEEVTSKENNKAMNTLNKARKAANLPLITKANLIAKEEQIRRDAGAVIEGAEVVESKERHEEIVQDAVIETVESVPESHTTKKDIKEQAGAGKFKHIPSLVKIISGAQTGADLAGIDTAIAMKFPYGGAIPKGRLNEDKDNISVDYTELEEIDKKGYPHRTKKNIEDADGTIVFHYGNKALGAGSRLTVSHSKKKEVNKPVLVVPLPEDNNGISTSIAADKIIDFIVKNDIKTLNIAGGRESTNKGLYVSVANTLSIALSASHRSKISPSTTTGGVTVAETPTEPTTGKVESETGNTTYEGEDIVTDDMVYYDTESEEFISVDPEHGRKLSGFKMREQDALYGTNPDMSYNALGVTHPYAGVIPKSKADAEKDGSQEAQREWSREVLVRHLGQERYDKMFPIVDDPVKKSKFDKDPEMIEAVRQIKGRGLTSKEEAQEIKALKKYYRDYSADPKGLVQGAQFLADIEDDPTGKKAASRMMSILPFKGMEGANTPMMEEIIREWAATDPKFSNDTLDDHMNKIGEKGKKPAGRKHKEPTEKSHIYSGKSIPIRISKDPSARKDWEEARFNEAQVWFRNILQRAVVAKNSDKTVNFPSAQQRLIDGVFVMYDSAIRDVMIKHSAPSSAAYSARKGASRPYQPGEVAKSQLLWVDDKGFDRLVSIYGPEATFKNFYLPFLEALHVARDLMNQSNAMHKQVSENRNNARSVMIARWRDRGMIFSDEDIAGIANNMVEQAMEPHMMQFLKGLKKNKNWINHAIDELRSGTPPQKMHPITRKGIVDVAAKMRSVSRTEQADEFVILSQLLKNLSEIAVRHNLADANIDVPTVEEIAKLSKKNAPVEWAEGAEKLGIDKYGWRVMMYPRGKKGYMAIPAKEGLRDKQQGWRADEINHVIYVEAGNMIGDQGIQDIKDIVLAVEAQGAIIPGDAKFEANLEKLDSIGAKILKLSKAKDRMDRSFEASFLASPDGKSKKALLKERYIINKRSKSSEYKDANKELDKLIAQKDKLETKNEKLGANRETEALKRSVENKEAYLKSVAAKVSDEHLARETKSPTMQKKFLDYFYSEFRDIHGNQVTGREYIGKQQLNKGDYRKLIGALIDYTDHNSGLATASGVLEGKLEAESPGFVESWWKDMESDPATKKLLPMTWKQLNSKVEKVIGPTQEIKRLRARGMTEAAAKKQVQDKLITDVKITIARFAKLSTPQLQSVWDSALIWKTQQERKGKEGGGREKRLITAKLLALGRKNQKAREAEQAGKELIRAIGIEEEMDQIRRALEESKKKKVSSTSPRFIMVEHEGETVEVDAEQVVADTLAAINGEVEKTTPDKAIPAPVTYIKASGKGAEKPTLTMQPADTEIEDVDGYDLLANLAKDKETYTSILWDKYLIGVEQTIRKRLVDQLKPEAQIYAIEFLGEFGQKANTNRDKFKSSASTTLKAFLDGQASNYARDKNTELANRPDTEEFFDETTRTAETEGEFKGDDKAVGADEFTEFRKGTYREDQYDEMIIREVGISINEVKKNLLVKIVDGDPMTAFVADKDHLTIQEQILNAARFRVYRKLRFVGKVGHDEAFTHAMNVQTQKKSLTRSQKATAMMSRVFGVPIVYLDNLGVWANGMAYDGAIALDSALPNRAFFTYGHELFHVIMHIAKKNKVLGYAVKDIVEKLKTLVMASEQGRQAFNKKRLEWVVNYQPGFVDSNKRQPTDDEVMNGTWNEFLPDLLGLSIMTEEFYMELEKLDPEFGKVVKSAVQKVWESIIKWSKAMLAVITGRKSYESMGIKEKLEVERIKAITYKGLPHSLRNIMDKAPADMMDIAQQMALLVSKMPQMVNIQNRRVSFTDIDMDIAANIKIDGKDADIRGIAKGVLENNQDVIPAIVDLVNNSEYSPVTIRENIRTEIGDIINKAPGKYKGQYAEFLRRMDVILYPDAYRQSMQTMQDWMREYVDEDVSGKPFKKWFGKSKQVDEDGNPIIWVMKHTGMVTEAANSNKAISTWVDSDGTYHEAHVLGQSPDAAFAARSELDNVIDSGLYNNLTAFVRAEETFDVGKEEHQKIMGEFVASNWNLLQAYDIDMNTNEIVAEGDQHTGRDIVKRAMNIYAIPEFLQFLSEKGFDSAVFYSGGPQLIVFNGNQIKSATKNTTYLNATDNVMAMVTESEEGAEVDPFEDFTDMGLDEATINRVRNLPDLRGWRFSERALNEFDKRDEIDRTKVRTRLGLFPSSDADMKWYDEIFSNSFDIAERFPGFRPVHEVELTRETARMDSIHQRSQSPNKKIDEANTIHELLDLPVPSRIKVTQALQLGDKYAHEITEEELGDGKFWSKQAKKTVELPSLTNVESEAFKATRQTLELVRQDMIDSAVRMLFKPYSKTPFYLALQKSVAAYWKAMDSINAMEVDEELSWKEGVDEDGNPLKKARRPSDDQMLRIRSAGSETLLEEQWDEYETIFNSVVVDKFSGEEASRADQLWALRSEWKRHPGYFPRMRKGSPYVAEIYINQGTKNEKVIFSYRVSAIEFKNIFNNKPIREYTQLEKYLENDDYYGPLLASGKASYRTVQKKQMADDIFGEISPVSLQAFMNAAITKLKAKGELGEAEAEELRASVFQELANQLKARGFARHSIRRGERFIPGFEEGDGGEMLNDYITGAAGFRTKQEAAWGFFKAMESIDPVVEASTFRHAQNFIADMLRNTDRVDAVSAKVRGMAFTYFLAGSLKPVMVNFTQNFTAAAPELLRYMPVGEAHSRLFRSMKDVGGILNPIEMLRPGGKPTFNTKNLSAEEAKALKGAILRGVTVDQYVRELLQYLKARGGWFYKAAGYLAKPFSYMEQFNRASAFLTMFRWARDNGYSVAMASKEAEYFVYRTHYLIGKANLPSIARGESMASRIGAKNALLFRSFTHNYLLNLRRWHSRGEYKSILLSFAYIAMFGGMLAVPFMDDLAELLEKITKKPLKSNLRKMADDSGTSGFYNLTMLGVPSLLGADISASMAITAPWSANDAVFGVWGGIGQKLKGAKESYEVNDYARAMEQLAPMFISHPLRAARSFSYPVSTPSGSIIHDPTGQEFQYTTSEAFWRAIGFRPTREAVGQMDRRSKGMLIGMMEKLKYNINKEYTMAYRRKDFKGMERARAKSHEYNRDVLTLGLKGKISRMTPKTMAQSEKRRRAGKKKQLSD